MGNVTGSRANPTNFFLNDVPTDPANGKLAVGPPFIPSSLYGPYWVVAAGSNDPSNSNPRGPYDWALISGGAPSQQGSRPGTCSTGTGSGSGLRGVLGRLANRRGAVDLHPGGVRGPRGGFPRAQDRGGQGI